MRCATYGIRRRGGREPKIGQNGNDETANNWRCSLSDELAGCGRPRRSVPWMMGMVRESKRARSIRGSTQDYGGKRQREKPGSAAPGCQ
jgi:hypothetical protein